MELEHKIEWGSSGSSQWAAYYRVKPPVSRTMWQKLKDCLNGVYQWKSYLRFREDAHLTGYDRWGVEPKYFSTPKEAKDYYLANMDGFVHDAEIQKMVLDKYHGNT